MISNLSRQLITSITENSGDSPSALEDVCLFSINTNYIGYFDQGLQDPDCRNKLIEFFTQKNMWKRMEDVFKAVYPNCHYDRELMLCDPHFNNWNTKHNFEWNVVQGLCLDMTEVVLLKHDAYIDRDFFNYFFAYRLAKKDNARVIDFLTYNFIDHFAGDISGVPFESIRTRLPDYFFYLERILVPEYKALIGPDRLELLKEYTHSQPAVANHSPSRPKTKIIVKVPLENFFYVDGQANADLFRTEVIESILRGRDGKLKPGAKGILNMVVKYLLYEENIWRSNLKLSTIACTLQKEIGFKTLNPQGYQKDRIKEVTSNLRRQLSKVSWITRNK